MPTGEQLPNSTRPAPNSPLMHAMGELQGSLEAIAGIATGNPVLMAVGIGLLGTTLYAVSSQSHRTPSKIVLTDEHVIGIFSHPHHASSGTEAEVIPLSAISKVEVAVSGSEGFAATSRVVCDTSSYSRTSTFVYGWGRLRRARSFCLSRANAARVQRALARWREEHPSPLQPTLGACENLRCRQSAPFRA